MASSSSGLLDTSIATYRRAAFEQRHRFSPTTYGGHTRAAAFASVSRLLAGTRTGRILARHQSPFQTLEQSRFVKRLAQKTDCPGLHRLLSNPLLGEGSNENDRRAVVACTGKSAGYCAIAHSDEIHRHQQR